MTDPTFEKSHSDLTPLLEPRSIAVVGASQRPGSFGHYLYTNLRNSGFRGVLYPVNPNHRHIETVPTVSDLAHLPEPVDLAILLVPAPLVPEVARQGVEAGTVRSLMVLSGGFRESGAQGAEYEDELQHIAQAARVPLVGPNCVGITNTDPTVRMHGMFADRPMPQHGRVAFVSQSGALCLSILDAARSRGIGFSKFISIGNDLCHLCFDGSIFLLSDCEASNHRHQTSCHGAGIGGGGTSPRGRGSCSKIVQEGLAGGLSLNSIKKTSLKNLFWFKGIQL